MCGEWCFRETPWSIRWYERILQHRVPEVEKSVWKHTHIVSGVQKSALNLGHNIARGAKYSLRSGGRYSEVGILCLKFGARFPEVGILCLKFGARFSEVRIICLKSEACFSEVGIVYPESEAWFPEVGIISPRFGAYKWDFKTVCPESRACFYRFSFHKADTHCSIWNVSDWSLTSSSTTRGYDFVYDNLDRLTSATYGETGSLQTNRNRYNTSYSYDKNGNIQTLSRKGLH